MPPASRRLSPTASTPPRPWSSASPRGTTWPRPPSSAPPRSAARPARGTHPDPKAACAALKSTGGTFDRLLSEPDPDRACPMHYAPVTVSAVGVWEGRRVAWDHTFANSCTMAATLNGNAVFAF
ncbi:SSI family serine proteinase inhibitor [Streptomyces sp. CH8.1]|uniref:SSI family serine proteinase inhibitor n=1 Tax=Streptomyces sp. CH8.1 TaxID=3439546 RepID=UPI003D9FED87